MKFDVVKWWQDRGEQFPSEPTYASLRLLEEAIRSDERAAQRAEEDAFCVEEYPDGLLGVFKTNPDGSRNLKVLTPQASAELRHSMNKERP